MFHFCFRSTISYPWMRQTPVPVCGERAGSTSLAILPMPAFQKDFGGACVVMCDSEVTWYTVQSDKCDTWSKGHHTAVGVISVLVIHAATPHWQPYYAQLFSSILSLSGLLHCVSISRLLDTVSLWWHKLMTPFTTAPLVNICWIIQGACNVNCYMTLGFCVMMVVSSTILTVKWL